MTQIKKLRKSLKNRFKTVEAIEIRLSELISQDLNRELTNKEKTEETELKRLRNQINPKYNFFG